ncbi:MAG: HAD-IC family P-type ATPase [Candidatus Zambryskibacteria bacterium]|nr:HAD-IC family P-type ATPase [Candidatus Zambryskibacteria bacterium]
MGSATEIAWHTKPVSKVLEILKSSEHGLSSIEVKHRLEENGPNVLPESRPDNVALIFLRQFQSPLIYILLAAALAVFFIGEKTDGIVIITVLILNAVVGSIQEGRARNTLLALKQYVETKAVVLRDDKEIIIADSQVVVGDIILLQGGEKIAADARIISAQNLKIDESSLTGESGAVHKTSDTLDNPNLTAQEERNMLFKGTHVVAGNGKAIVVRTGVETIIGKIAKEVSLIEKEIPLKTNIRNLSRIIILITVGVSALLFIVGIISGKSIIEMLVFVISISVSIIPEGLPVAITVILATGVWRMSKRNALIKRLQAVEALGQAKVIAVDKTGTITKNEMVVQTIHVDGQMFEIDGVGYEPKGDIRINKQIINPPNHPELLLCGKIAALSASARVMLQEKTTEWKISGDPTEAAMVVLARKLGFNRDDLEHESPLMAEIPFDYNTKYHATLHKDKETNFLAVAGAPEVILENSNKIWQDNKEIGLSPERKEELISIFFDISRRGLRVLALASSSRGSDDLNQEDVMNLTFTGFCGLKDALRLEVKEATKRAIAAGMRVVMITGDHQTTAEAIAKEAGIYKTGDTSLTGVEIDKFSDGVLKEYLTKTSVFARVTPEHKLRIINAYKARGEIIAMTGDGVNDAPSLVAADLGVAMGKIGTEVAKEASDIVLLDDNFGSIVSAIEEGRNIYKTITKVVLYLLSTSLGELLVITGAIFVGLPLPLLPAQIIWLNFVTDGFFTVALAMEPKEHGLLSKTFKKPGRYLVDTLMGQRILLMALPMLVITLVLFQNYFETDLAKAWTISLTVLAVFQWFNAWNCRSENKSIFQANIFENRFMAGATLAALSFQILAVYNPLFQRFLHTVPLALSDWLVIIALATSIIWVEEVRKFLWRNKKSSLSLVPPLQVSQA